MKSQERDKILFWLEEHNTSNKKGKINILNAPLKLYLDSFVVEGTCNNCIHFASDYQGQMCGYHKYCSLDEIASCENWEEKNV